MLQSCTVWWKEDSNQELEIWCLVQSHVELLLQIFFFFPQSVYSPVPILKVKDPIDRTIDFVPTKTPYDPRWMLAGRPNPSKQIFGGQDVPRCVLVQENQGSTSVTALSMIRFQHQIIITLVQSNAHCVVRIPKSKEGRYLSKQGRRPCVITL